MKLTQKLLLGLAVAALPALCGPINSTGQWTAFGWNGNATALAFGASGYTVGSTVVLSSSTSGNSFSDPFTIAGPGVFTIQDIQDNGDRFYVFVDGAVALASSNPTGNSSANCGNDPVACAAAGSAFSSGSIHITGAGSHTISISVIAEANSEGGLGSTALFKFLADGTAPPTGGGGGAAAVPEPTTFSLMGLGLGGLLYGWRARRKA